MQLTRTVLTIALAANTASALPLCTSGNCANALEANEDGLDAASVPHEKRSHTSAHPHLDTASHAGSADDEFPNSQSHGTPQMKPQSYEQDADAPLTGSGKQSEHFIHISETPESHFGAQDSTRSSGYNRMPFIQENAMQNQHDNTANGANHPKNKMGFAVRVRELFKAFGHSQNQMHTEQQHQQEQNSENSLGMRQDRAQEHMSADRMHMIDKDQHAGAPQAQGSRYKTWSMFGAWTSSHQGQKSATQADKAQEEMNHSNYHQQKQEQENARPDNAQHHSAMSQDRKHARSHTDRSGAYSQEMEQMNNNQQNQNHEQHQEEQGLEQHDYHEEEGSQQQQQMQQMQQMQPQKMRRMECLRAAMGDVNRGNLCADSQNNVQSHI